MAYEYRGVFDPIETPQAMLALRSQTAPGLYPRHAKRVFDIALVLLFAVPAVVLIVIMALLVATDGHMPFYRQERVGRHGRVFGMWKLRTMVPRADMVLGAYLDSNPAARAEWDLHQKLRDDPRITRVGRILRRTSLDELPQLWNVLRGEMSVVGPRPIMCNQRALYPGTEYYQLLPGITGFWQVSLRNESSFHERAYFDQAYFRQLSLRTDLRVILRTAGVVVRATGH